MSAGVRVGIGYDVHRLVAGRPLVLGGVTIPAPLGLEGHSDADVAIHAIMDALLGAAALGDIGQHFPPSDPAYKDIDSRRLLALVRDLLDRHGWRPVNVDCTIVAERPKIAPHVEAMRAALGAALGIAPERIGVKATTNEGIGFIGRGEGIAALAVALIERAEE
ncbi:MAG: 2-C-methyl-D-erythritol 2,4-cyclodiphosphate synthase [Chloroflexota bacterium]|nr:2-C-methyl-D-erythritol 2,4-cyclodiphosphate synthase [Chloroflexota bacterium]